MNMTTGIDEAVRGHLDAIERDGYTIIPDVLDAATIDAALDELARIERESGIEPARNAFEGHHTWRIYNLLARGALWQRFAIDPRVLPVVEGVLDEGCLVSSLSSIAIGSDETPQMLHSDDQVIGLARPHPALVCNTMWAWGKRCPIRPRSGAQDAFASRRVPAGVPGLRQGGATQRRAHPERPAGRAVAATGLRCAA